MQTACTHCGTKHILDDRQIGGFLRVKFRCTACNKTVQVETAHDSDRTSISFARADAVPFVEPTTVSDQRGLALPPDRVLTLKVLEGKSRGVAYTLARPRIIIGRLDADLAVDDPEVSRWHCAVEVSGSTVRLRDLDSRNGIYIGNEMVRDADLQHLSEFRIGSTRVQLTITPK